MSLLASDDSSSWKSPSGDFAFGFRPLADGSLFLLAIWFEKIPERTIVRYANGSHLVPKGSKVELKADGQFALEDPLDQFTWQAQSGAHGVAYAAMLDTGNSVLASEDSSYVWGELQESCRHHLANPSPGDWWHAVFSAS